MGRRGFVAALLAAFVLTPLNILAQAQRRMPRRPRRLPYEPPRIVRYPQMRHIKYRGDWEYGTVDYRHFFKRRTHRTGRGLRYWGAWHPCHRHEFYGSFYGLQPGYKSPARIYWERLTEKLFR